MSTSAAKRPSNVRRLDLADIAARHRAKARPEDDGAQSLSASVIVPALREAIVGGRLAPGSRLSEVQIGEEFQVSRTPVREAFAQLEQEGLVTIVPRVGAFVRTVTLDDVEEIYAVRAALEAVAVQLAAKRLTPLGKARLEDVVETMRRRLEANDHDGYVEALDRFYAEIMSLTGNATLRKTHETLLGPVRRLRRIAMARERRMEESYHQTVVIKDAIISGDPRCADHMRLQLEKACEAARQVLLSAGAMPSKSAT